MDGGSTENPDISSMEDLGRLENDNTSFIFTTIIWSFILLLSFSLNATLLLAFVKRPGLRTISNRFVMNLSTSNLLTITLLYPLLITDQSTPSAVHCTLAEGATALVTTSSIFSVLLIAIDQYLAVIDPLRYRTRIDNLKCTLLIIIVWILSIIIGILAIFNTNNNINSHSGTQQSLWQNCHSVLPAVESALPTVEIALPTIDAPNFSTITNSSLSSDFLTIYNLAYTIIYIIIIYLAPFITIIWIYLCIYTAAHNNSERTRRTGSRPVLTVTNYLTDDDYLPLRHDSDSRIKNISSLSSIDESIEITSQLQRHLSPSPIIEEDISSINNINNNNNDNNSDINGRTHVIFTVGSQNNDITQFDTKETTETMENMENIRPYSGHIGDLDSKGVDSCINSPNKNLEENGGEYGKEIGQNDRPYICHIGDFNCEGAQRHLNGAEEDLEEDGSQYGKNGNNARPYIGHIKPYEPGDHVQENGDDNDQTGEYGKLPYIGHISENGKIYGIDESYGDLPKDDEKYGTKKLPYIGHMAENGENLYVCNESSEFNDQERHYATESDSNGGHMPQNGGLMPPKSNPRQNTRTANYINSLRHRISNGSLFKYREETRAGRISALVIVMGFVCWTPFFTIVVIKNMTIGFVYHEVDVVGVGCFLLGTILSPMLFGYRSRRVKRELRKLFCFRRELAYKNNRSLMAKKVLKRRNSSTWGVDSLGDKGGKLGGGFWNFYRGKVKEPGKVQFVHVSETALTVDTCRSSFSSGASTQVSSTSTDDS